MYLKNIIRGEKKKKHKKLLISVLTFVIAMLAYVPSVHAAADIQTGKEVIQSYFDNVNTKDVENILEKLDGEYGKNAQHIYTNKENIDNYVGVFNIKKSEVLSIVEASSSERLALDVTDYKGEKITVYKVSVDITKYLDEGEYIEGNNKLYFVLNTNNKIIGCQTLDDMLDMNNVSAIDNGISLLSYDTPVKKPSSNPSTIKVYRTATGKIQSINFKKYCKVVTTCEVGYSKWDNDALRACAMAIKNYGIVRIKRHKYAGLGYDVKDNTSDQVYNPNKSRIKKCDNAVNYIWDYYLVDANSKLFPGFHVANVNVNSYAAKNKGILSQEKAQSLASKNDYSWKQILKYFYTRKSGTSYYNKEVAVGSVSIVE